MGWRLARSLEVLRKQVDEKWPTRDKADDGTIGDQAHQATKSEHNPDRNGVVRAMDITNDKKVCNSRKLAEMLVASRDPRILYLISNAEILSSQTSPWKWRPYNGKNPHDRHMHISVVSDPHLYDDVRAWKLDGKPIALPPIAEEGENVDIVATVFGGDGDEQPAAYSDVEAGWPHQVGVALPMRFTGKRPTLSVWTAHGRVRGVPIVDVGPWYPSHRGPADPYWITNERPRAETDRRTNRAGIDLTPELAKLLGVDGKGLVNWAFEKGTEL